MGSDEKYCAPQTGSKTAHYDLTRKTKPSKWQEVIFKKWWCELQCQFKIQWFHKFLYQVHNGCLLFTVLLIHSMYLFWYTAQYSFWTNLKWMFNEGFWVSLQIVRCFRPRTDIFFCFAYNFVFIIWHLKFVKSHCQFQMVFLKNSILFLPVLVILHQPYWDLICLLIKYYSLDI